MYFLLKMGYSIAMLVYQRVSPRFSISMQMFALSGFAGTWMQFLDASKSADIIPPWRPGWSIGTALGGFGSLKKQRRFFGEVT